MVSVFRSFQLTQFSSLEWFVLYHLCLRAVTGKSMKTGSPDAGGTYTASDVLVGFCVLVSI